MKTLRLAMSFLTLTICFSLISCETDSNGMQEDDVRQEYAGTWLYVDTPIGGGSKKDAATVRVEVDPNSDNGIRLYNFANLGNNAYALATISGSNGTNVSIESQEVAGFTVSGQGTSNLLHDNIRLTIALDSDNFSVNMDKQ